MVSHIYKHCFVAYHAIMPQIQIDDQVFAELSRRAVGFNVTPNDVLRRILELPALSSAPVFVPAANSAEPPALPSKLGDFLNSERFRRNSQAIDRYLVLLGWLHATGPSEFSKVAFAFERGSRIYFAKSEKEILDSAPGSTARQIPQAPMWALTTLDNKSKRIVLEDLLRALGHSPAEVSLVLAELPDSGIRRSHARARLLDMI